MDGLPFTNALSTALSCLPAADRTGMSGLSISDLQKWSTAKANNCNQRPLAILAIQNILAPIHCLPPELLSRIFIEAWHDQRSLRLTHVCHLWCSLLLDTSEFWAVAIAGDQFRLVNGDREGFDKDYLDAACLRSAPRHISLHLSSISPRCHLQIIQYVDHIISLHISTNTHDQLTLLWKVLHTGMPHLVDLAIRVSDSVTGWVGPTPLSTEELPRLTRLTLPPRLFRRSWPNTLQEIALRSHPSHGNAKLASPFLVSLEMVLRALDDYPRLRVLDIRDNVLFHHGDSQPPSRVFPMLEHLRIRSSVGAVSGLLSLLSCPYSKLRLDIGIVSNPHFPYGVYSVRGFVLEAVAALVDHIAITGGPTSTIRGFAAGTEHLRLTTDFDLDGWTSAQVERTLCVFERTGAPVSHLLLMQHAMQRMPVTFATGCSIFPAFPYLTHLTLHARRDICAKFIQALRPLELYSCYRYGAAPSASGPPLLPLLKDLTVGVATKHHLQISKSLWHRPDLTHSAPANGSVSIITTHFSECCRLFPGCLYTRMSQGCRLSCLEFFSYEEGCIGKPASIVSHVGLAAFGSGEVVKQEFEPLQRFVDGPVMFSGFRFFMADG
ncbi:hypothetical protein V8D89_004391 [Ganoderma adspersum]